MRMAQVIINNLNYYKMKKMFLKRVAIAAIAMFTISMAAVAQEKGDMAAGASVLLGTGDSYTNIGVGAKFRYNILDNIRAEAQLNYWLPKTYVSMIDVSVNGHYLFNVAEGLTVYPLAGLGILHSRWDAGGWGYSLAYSHSYFAFNLGGGVDYQLAGNLSLNGELGYKIADYWNRLSISAGVVYKF
jgi:outer membrane protein X